MQNILFSQRQIEFEKLCKSEAVKIKKIDNISSFEEVLRESFCKKLWVIKKYIKLNGDNAIPHYMLQDLLHIIVFLRKFTEEYQDLLKSWLDISYMWYKFSVEKGINQIENRQSDLNINSLFYIIRDICYWTEIKNDDKNLWIYLSKIEKLLF